MMQHRTATATTGSTQSSIAATQTTALLKKLESRLVKRILKSYDILDNPLNPPRPYITVSQAGELIASAYSHLAPATPWPFPSPPNKIAAGFSACLEHVKDPQIDREGVLVLKISLVPKLAYKYLKEACGKLQLPEDITEKGAFHAAECAAKVEKSGNLPALTISYNEASKAVRKMFAADKQPCDIDLLSILGASQLGPNFCNLLYVMEYGEDNALLIALNMPAIMQVASKGAPFQATAAAAYDGHEEDVDGGDAAGRREQEVCTTDAPTHSGRDTSYHSSPDTHQTANVPAPTQPAVSSHYPAHGTHPLSQTPDGQPHTQTAGSAARDGTRKGQGTVAGSVTEQFDSLHIQGQGSAGSGRAAQRELTTNGAGLATGVIDMSDVPPRRSAKDGARAKGKRQGGVLEVESQDVQQKSEECVTRELAGGQLGDHGDLRGKRGSVVADEMELETCGVSDKQENKVEREQDVNRVREAAIDAALKKKGQENINTPKLWLQRRLIQEMLKVHPPLEWNGTTPIFLEGWRTVDLLQQFWFESTQQKLFRVPAPFKQGERVFVETLPCFEAKGPKDKRRGKDGQEWTAVLDAAVAKDVKTLMTKKLEQEGGPGGSNSREQQLQASTPPAPSTNGPQSQPQPKSKTKSTAPASTTSIKGSGAKPSSLQSLSNSAKTQAAKSVLELLVCSYQQRAKNARDFMHHHILLTIMLQAVEHPDWAPSLRCALAGNQAEEKLNAWWRATTAAGMFLEQPCPFDSQNINSFLSSLMYLSVLPTPPQFAHVCRWMCQINVNELSGDYWELVGTVGVDSQEELRERLCALRMLRELGAKLEPEAVAFMRDATNELSGAS